MLHEAGFDFEVMAVDVEETYPQELAPVAVVAHLAKKKLTACQKWLADTLVITADTLVYQGPEIMGKPHNRQHAVAMLQELAGTMHEVTTSVCLGYRSNLHQFSVTTKVYFAGLSDAEITYYVDHYKPFDKAGSYGIQEWIGQIGIRKIEGSYTNVVGLPMHETYRAIMACNRQWLT